jgi:hypothetical protein
MNMTREELDAAGDWAFPAQHTPEHSPGMTLRDWFAGQALAGLLASHDWSRFLEMHSYASDAYGTADAMLEARKK